MQGRNRVPGSGPASADAQRTVLQQFACFPDTEFHQVLLERTYAPSFNNLAMDADGFIYATTSDTAAQEVAFRLNPKGENVLRQEGYWPVIGNLKVDNSFVDVAINDYGGYALLDQSTGRIFLYDFDDELISIFGKNGDLQGDFRSLSAIAWFGDRLVATDKSLRCAYVYEMTEFGRAAMGATNGFDSCSSRMCSCLAWRDEASDAADKDRDTAGEGDGARQGSGEVLAAENETRKFYLDTDTLNFRVEDKATRKSFSALKPEGSVEDQSPLRTTFVGEDGTFLYWNAYEYCVDHQTYTLGQIPDEWKNASCRQMVIEGGHSHGA